MTKKKPTESPDLAGLNEEEFDPEIERLVQIAEGAEFESGTLTGDLRDAMLDMFRNRKKPWDMLSESEQRDMATGLDNVARVFLRKAVVVVAEQDAPSVHAKLSGFNIKDGAIKGTFSAVGDIESVTRLFALDGHEVILLSADSRPFHGQRRDPEIAPDAPELEFPNGPDLNGPAGDTDLAGEDEEIEEAPALEDEETGEKPVESKGDALEWPIHDKPSDPGLDAEDEAQLENTDE